MRFMVNFIFLLMLSSPVFSEILTESFSPDAVGHQVMDVILKAEHERNLLGAHAAELVSYKGLLPGEVSWLTDGTAGTWIGPGRIQVSGKPSRIVFRLDKPRRVDEIRIFTSNSDARANQDYEIRLSKTEEFPAEASFTSGEKVLGADGTPFMSRIMVSGVPEYSETKFQFVEFLFWDTYSAGAGSPGKGKTAADSWCSVVELQVLGNSDDSDTFLTDADRREWEKKQREMEFQVQEFQMRQLTAGKVDGFLALRRAVKDLSMSFPERYADKKYMEKLDSLEKELLEFIQQKPLSEEAESEIKKLAETYESLRREILLSNPLLDDFNELLVLKRGARSPRLGLPLNWQSNSSLPKNGFDDSLVRMPVKGCLHSASEDKTESLPVVYKPEKPVFVGDVDLHWDGEKILFSSVGANNRWQVFEYFLDGSAAPKELTSDEPDVDSYDACYLPDDRIIYTSTAIMVGVPCVYGDSHVATLFLMNGDGSAKRQLTFDQDHSWNPSVLNNGRILYQRWEYADIPHSNSRILFHCNPDGTSQLSYYGSNSYWPNSMWNARAIPGHDSMVVTVITGHHDTARAGELVLLDPARGRAEADGCVQRIPGYGKKVEPIIADGLTGHSWPKFLHPYPLSEKYFIVSCKPSPSANWGIYLVDVFDNMLLLREEPGYALLEPIPLRKTARPPVVHDRIDLNRKDAEVYIADIYNGPGLEGVPRGTIKKLRLFTYHFSYQNIGGLMGIVGADGPWDIKEVLGTVPVAADGSVRFRIPANTPISLQPLDENGQAIQLMRSWLTAMPGEVLQCNGCHEDTRQAAVPRMSTGFLAKPADIKPWYGKRRGFSYAREVQPIIDRYCLECHDGSEKAAFPDLRGDVFVKNYHSIQPGNGTGYIRRNAHFSVGYYHLQKYVRRGGIESDIHLLTPKEFAADTTELIQILKKGHHGVNLSEEGWDRLITWIDLNCPYHGTWTEATKNPGTQRKRRMELAEKYANIDPHDSEGIYETVIENNQPPRVRQTEEDLSGARFPFSFQIKNYIPERRNVELGNGLRMEFVRIPAGKLIEGDREVIVETPFWMSTTEVTNEQFALFDPGHDSRVESKHCYQFGIHGYPMNKPELPVCRVSWNDADAFCRWLTEKLVSAQSQTDSGVSGSDLGSNSDKEGWKIRKVSLPTEAQWEWAARAGSMHDFSYGDKDTDFSPYANFADYSIRYFVTDPYSVDSRYRRELPEFDNRIPQDARFDDKTVLTAKPGSFAPNRWGLYDMHGNVAEWTETGTAAGGEIAGKKIVKGGSWYDRPYRGACSYRQEYPAWQKVFNVGFRVILVEE
ncbi:MAG: SUMF1/EgtB/PvdO family nonheme iron enzyme [Planctomycetia bacterium]|nr:SUMF1/EgtB/PvdO family nonheme iron enzyme [Planctomycetia bacterium]